MMSTPRFISLTALAASLFIVILTITQANGLSDPDQAGTVAGFCLHTAGLDGCDPGPMAVEAATLP